MNPDAPLPAAILFGGSSDVADNPTLRNSIAPFPPPAIPDHEMIRLIGRGSYGQVWLAKNAVGTLRAIKVVYRATFEKEEHFEREFKGLQKFEPISRSHDGFVDILQLGRNEEAGFFYYVMELADDSNAERGTWNVESTLSHASDTSLHRTGDGQGEGKSIPSSEFRTPHSYAPRTLRDDLRARGHLPLTECLSVGAKLVSALEHLHAQGLVHRDIKPSNIIFVNGEPKLADIGLVTNIDDTHSMVGTVGYIPPEGPGAAQADIYSLGKVLYEIALGKDRQDFPQLPPDLQMHPEYAALLELNEVILRACESDPRRRYQSAQEMQADLVLLQHGESVKQTRTRQRRRAIAKKLGFAATAAGLLIAGLPFLKGSKHEHTPNPEAARLYERGRWYYSQLTPEAHGKALEYLNQAVRADPKFVQPYGELMALYTWYLLPGPQGEEERLRRTKEIADRALAIDPNAAEGHTALSWCKFLERNWRGAEDEILRAIRLNPNLPIAHGVYSFYLSMLGRTEEARREGQRAEELEPPGSERVTAIIAAWPFMAQRRFDLAIAQLQRVLELDRNFTYGHVFLADCYDAQTNYLAAIDEFKTFALLVGQDPARVAASYGALRQAYDTQGEQGYLRKWIELIRADQSLPDEQQMFVENDLVGYYARLGEKEKALEELEKHFDDSQVWHQIKFEAMYDSLHNEPRFKTLLKRAGLQK